MRNITLNKLIEDFSHLPLDDKEYAMDVTPTVRIEVVSSEK